MDWIDLGEEGGGKKCLMDWYCLTFMYLCMITLVMDALYWISYPVKYFISGAGIGIFVGKLNEFECMNERGVENEIVE